MRKITKRYAASGLILLLAMPLFFSVAALIIQKKIQHHNKERLETETLQTITISRDDLHWVKPGKEVALQGELFDVKSIRTEGDQVILTGFFDKKESDLVRHLSKLTDQKETNGNPIGRQAVKFIFFPVFTVMEEVTCSRPIPPLSAVYHPYDERITGVPETTLLQPPRA